MRELARARRRAGDRARRRIAHVRGDARAAARARAVRVARRRRSRRAGSGWTAPRARGRSRATWRRSSSCTTSAGCSTGPPPTRSSPARNRRRRSRARSRSRSGRALASPRRALGEGAVAIVDRALTLARAGAIELEGGEAGQVAGDAGATLARPRRAGARARRRGRVRRRRFHHRRRRLRRCHVPPRRALARRPVDARRSGRRGDRRQDRDQRGRQERRRGVLAAEGACSAIPRCSRRCRRASGPAAWPRSSRPACSRADGCGSSSRAGSRASASIAARSELVQRCAGVKTLVVAADPEDRGPRAILNLGHTIGHGIESVAGYGGLSHGECVSIGLVAALRLSERARRPRGRHCRARGRAAGAPRAAGACARARLRGGARGHAPRQEAQRRGRTGWCCWRRSGGPSTVSPSTSRCSPTPYARATAAH